MLLAQDTNLDLSAISLPLLVAAAIASALWLVQLAAFAFVTRPRKVAPGPPTMDLRSEPPAVVNLLTNGCRVTPVAVPATLLDLAARDIIDIEEYGTDETVCRIRNGSPTGLQAYEQMVYDHLSSVAVDRVVPAQALTTGPKGNAAAWLRKFESGVIGDARARGLTQNRWSRPMWAGMRLTAIVASLLIIGAATQAGSFEAGIAVVVLAAAGGESLLKKLFGSQQPTPAGVEATAAWLGIKEYLGRDHTFSDLPAGAVKLWDKYMSYAAAMGLARAALRTLPMGAEDDHRAWSSYGGSWREVRVRYPRTRLIWGRPPLGGVLIGLAIGAAGAGLVWLMLQLHSIADGSGSGDQAARWAKLIADTGIAAGAVLVAWGARTLFISGSDLMRRGEVEGEIVRLRQFSRGENGIDYFMAVDDGKASHIKAWLVEPALYRQTREGEQIRAEVSPRLGHVTKIEAVQGAPRPEAMVTVEQPAAPAQGQAAPGIGGLGAIAAALAGAGQAAAVDPAALVTADDAAAVLGGPVQEASPMAGERLPIGGIRARVYRSVSDKGSAISVFAASGAIMSMLGKAGFEKGTPVEGVGDRAFLRDRSILVVKGDAAFMITLQGRHVADPSAVLTGLATRAAERIAAPAETAV